MLNLLKGVKALKGVRGVVWTEVVEIIGTKNPSIHIAIRTLLSETSLALFHPKLQIFASFFVSSKVAGKLRIITTNLRTHFQSQLRQIL